MLTPYPAYKDSSVPCLGRIPEHWEMLPIKAISKLRNKRGRTDLPLLSVYRDYGVIRKDSRNDNHNRDSDDLSAYKVVKPGYLVANKMKAPQGSLGRIIASKLLDFRLDNIVIRRVSRENDMLLPQYHQHDLWRSL